jgi:RNA polymerase sigma-70 factor (ECF subfamily)
VLEELLSKYWKPIYCYLRRKGYGNEQAKDLVQGFFQEVVLGRDFLRQADPTRGKFRTFLLTALDRYVIGVRRAETTKKRLPAGGLVRLDGMDAPELPEACPDLPPEEAFHHAWAATLLDQVLKTVETLCRESGHDIYWEVFRARVVRPIMGGVEPPSLREVCKKHGIPSETGASNMIVMVKRRFRVVLRRQVRQFVGSDAEAEKEIQELIRILSRS